MSIRGTGNGATSRMMTSCGSVKERSARVATGNEGEEMKNRNDRDSEMKVLWESQSLTLEEIGSRFGLTRERVRQVLRELGADTSSEVRGRRRENKERDANALSRKILGESIEVLSTLYDVGATKNHAVLLLSAFYPDLTRDQVEDAVERSSLRFHQEKVAPRFSEEFLTAGVHYILGIRDELTASRNEVARLIPARLLEEMIDHVAKSLMPTVPFEDILSTVAGSMQRGELLSEISLPHGKYEEIRAEIWKAEDWNGALPGYWPPTKQTVMKRLGGGYWVDAMEALGLGRSARKGRARGLLFYKEEDYNDTVRDFVTHCAGNRINPTYSLFDAWRHEESESGRSRPSAMSVRNFFGSWISAVQAGQKRY